MTATATLPGIIRSNPNVIIVTIRTTAAAWHTRRIKNVTIAPPFPGGDARGMPAWTPASRALAGRLAPYHNGASQGQLRYWAVDGGAHARCMGASTASPPRTRPRL